VTVVLVDKNKDNKLVFAADRRVSGGSRYESVARSKVRVVGNFMIAGSGDLAFCQQVLYEVDYQKINSRWNDYDSTREFLRKELIPIYESFIQKRKKYNSSVLVGYLNKLFYIDVVEDSLNFSETTLPTAIGSGGSEALSTYLTLQRFKKKLKLPVETMLKVSAQAPSLVDTSCDGHIDIIVGK